MADPVSLDLARSFVRIGNDSEDQVLSLLLAASKVRVEAATGLSLSDTSPAPLRLSVLLLAADAFERRDGGETPLALIEPWLASHRPSRL
jgi:hypothetical protein